MGRLIHRFASQLAPTNSVARRLLYEGSEAGDGNDPIRLIHRVACVASFAPSHSRCGVCFWVQPFPLVRVMCGPLFFSRYSMIIPATSLLVVTSMPSSPGDELTSMT
ncbi:MAG: hypothetical protein K0R45_1116, partial [Pseudomonas sp.]|nr:hypothetical protein [Pseudomonas sp.]